MDWKQVEDEGDKLIAAITNCFNEDLSEDERADADAEADRILDYFPSEHLAELKQYVEQYSNIQI